uniref:translation initiation factor IF-2-like n=1 Tax=Callithrix jacchus TaxID=9483 RepID=UPI0023DD0ED0|nr:translation initiation factor IF-2-like [Callithrix jacchus]
MLLSAHQLSASVTCWAHFPMVCRRRCEAHPVLARGPFPPLQPYPVQRMRPLLTPTLIAFSRLGCGAFWPGWLLASVGSRGGEGGRAAGGGAWPSRAEPGSGPCRDWRPVGAGVCKEACVRLEGGDANNNAPAPGAGLGRRPRGPGSGGRAGPRVRARRRQAYLDSASRRAWGRRARGPDGGGGGRMAAARRWRQRGGRARGLVALRLGGLRLAPRPRVLPGGAAGAAERRAAAASSSGADKGGAEGGDGGCGRGGFTGAGGGGRAPLAPQQRGPREGAVSEKTPKSPLALPAGVGGGTRWRRPGGAGVQLMDPGGRRRGDRASGGGGGNRRGRGADPASPLSRQYKRLGPSPRTCPSQNGGREREEVTQGLTLLSRNDHRSLQP